MLGRRGWLRAVGAWLAVLGVLAVAQLLPLGIVVSVLVVVGLVVTLARAGAPSRVSRWLTVASLVTGVASAAFVWWVAGLVGAAADAMTPEPAVAAWGGAGVVVFMLSAAALLSSAVVSARREDAARRPG